MTRTCKIGVHGRNDFDFHDLDYQVIRDSKVETVKMMSQSQPKVFAHIKEINPNIEIITRLHIGGFGERHHPEPTKYVNEAQQVMAQLQPYCQKFQIANEPNHAATYEGWGPTEADAHDFNGWFIEVYDRLKNIHPWASYGFPGLAVPDFLHHDRIWLDVCRPAIEKADWLGCHSYWQTPPDGRPSGIFNEAFGLTFKYYHEAYPDKVLEILECGNSNIQQNPPWPISEDDIAREYEDWLNEVFKYPYINSAAFFILSSPDQKNWDFFTWRREDGRVKPVVPRIGNMARPPLVPVSIRQPQPTPQPEPAPTPQSTATGDWTNQAVVDAFREVSEGLGLERWALLEQAGLSLSTLAADREGPYTDPAIESLSGLDDHQKSLLIAKLGGDLQETPPAQSPEQPEAGDTTGTVHATGTAYTNQNVIDAFREASGSLGLERWALLEQAGLSLSTLAADREGPYTDPPIETIASLSEAQKTAVQQELDDLLGTLG